MMKHFAARLFAAVFVLVMLPSLAVAQHAASPTFYNVSLGLPASYPGSLIFGNATSGTITVTPPTGALGTVTLTLPDTTGTLALSGGSVSYSQLAALSANQVLGALTATTPSGLSVPSCSTTTSALQWVGGTGFQCDTSSAPLASPAFTGSPTAPTQTAGDTSTDIATDAFVATSFAPLASPTFSGTSTIPNISSNGTYKLNNAKWFIGTAPTIVSGFGTSPSVQYNAGSAAFTITVGTGGTASTGIVGMPTASHEWVCTATDITSHSSSIFMQYVTPTSGSLTTEVTITNYNDTGTAAAWSAGDVLAVQCGGV